jgi:hypothetical protein
MRDFIMLHRPEEALADAVEIQKDEPNLAVRESQMAVGLAAVGRLAEARELFDEAIGITGEDALDPIGIALGFAYMVERENTLEWLKRPSMRARPALIRIRGTPPSTSSATIPNTGQSSRRFPK